MSITKFTGNLADKFGKTLPVPFIEKVICTDKNLEVRFSLYFDLDTYGAKNFDKYLEALTEHNISIACIIAANTRETGGIDKAYTDVVEGRSVAWSAARGPLDPRLTNWPRENTKVWFDTDSGGISSVGMPYGEADGGSNLYDVTPDFSTVESDGYVTLYYSAENRPIKKITWTKTLNANVGIMKFHWSGIHFGYESGVVDYVDLAMMEDSNLQALGLLAFSTTTSLEEIMDDIEDLQLTHPVHASLISDISYVNLVEDGLMATYRDTIYTDAAGNVVDEVMQAIDGSYYAVEPDLRESIKTDIKSLGGRTSTNPDLQSLYDNLSYVVQEYGSSVQFLTQVDDLRMAFPQKSSATQIGRFYQVLKKTLVEADYLVKQGLAVYKQLISNPRVINTKDAEGADNSLDLEIIPFGAPNINSTRFPGFNGYDLSWNIEDSYIYPGATRLSRQFEMDDEGSQYLFLETGWFFFDWEKALKRTSLIAQICHIDKLENFLGRDIFNKYFFLDKVYVYSNMIKINNDPAAAQQNGELTQTEASALRNGSVLPNSAFDRVCYTELQYEGASHTSTKKITFVRNKEEYGPAYGVTSTPGQKTSLALRSFEAAYPNSLITGNDKDYRLMAFAFNKVGKAPHFTTNQNESYNDFVRDVGNLFYEFEVRISDNTRQIYITLKNQWSQAYTATYNYSIAAGDECSYNSTVGYFNDFFINGAMAIYADEPHTAPWIVAPLYYYFFLDLFYNVFEGDLEKIKEKAIATSSLLSPETGNPSDIAKFGAAMTALNSAQFGANGWAHTQYKNGGGQYGSSTKIYGSGDTDATSTMEYTSAYTFFDLEPYGINAEDEQIVSDEDIERAQEVQDAVEEMEDQNTSVKMEETKEGSLMGQWLDYFESKAGSINIIGETGVGAAGEWDIAVGFEDTYAWENKSSWMLDNTWGIPDVDYGYAIDSQDESYYNPFQSSTGFEFDKSTGVDVSNADEWGAYVVGAVSFFETALSSVSGYVQEGKAWASILNGQNQERDTSDSTALVQINSFVNNLQGFTAQITAAQSALESAQTKTEKREAGAMVLQLAFQLNVSLNNN